jgi:hypothetical protein
MNLMPHSPPLVSRPNRARYLGLVACALSCGHLAVGFNWLISGVGCVAELETDPRMVGFKVQNPDSAKKKEAPRGPRSPRVDVHIPSAAQF